jgi:hypothetical protein
VGLGVLLSWSRPRFAGGGASCAKRYVFFDARLWTIFDRAIDEFAELSGCGLLNVALRGIFRPILLEGRRLCFSLCTGGAEYPGEKLGHRVLVERCGLYSCDDLNCVLDGVLSSRAMVFVAFGGEDML